MSSIVLNVDCCEAKQTKFDKDIIESGLQTKFYFDVTYYFDEPKGTNHVSNLISRHFDNNL